MLNSLKLLRALNDIHEEDIVLAGDIYFSNRKAGHIGVRRAVTFALAAVLLLSLGVAACAGLNIVGSAKAAEKVALEELEKWKTMGLIAEDLTVREDAASVIETDEYTGSGYWHGRIFPHSYDVRFRGGENDKYFLNLSVDTATGKIKAASFEAKADETDVPVREIEGEIPVDPDEPEGEWMTVTYYLYDNYGDIFPEDITVDRFCTLLAEYWGFTGYRLADTVDEFYDAHWSAVDGAALLKDIPANNYYLTIFFEGDQEGAPMYLQLCQYVGRVGLSFGTRHMVG